MSSSPRQSAYGVGNAKIFLSPAAIIQDRDPTTTDWRYPLMQQWLNSETFDIFQLVSKEENIGTWALTATGGQSAFTKFTMQAGFSPIVPLLGVGIINCQIIAASSTPFQSFGINPNEADLRLQISSQQSSSTLNANGVSHFDSRYFTVDAQGFVSSTGSGFTWIDQGTSITLTSNRGYFVTAATTQTLPASPVQGDIVKIICDTASTVIVKANTGQTIRQGNLASSTAGTFTNSLRGDSLDLVYRASTTQWLDLSGQGVWVVA